MRKIVLSTAYLVFALSAVMFVQSCKKDDSGAQKFYATIQQYNDDKVYINEPYSCWMIGDKVRIHGWEGSIGQETNGRYYILLDGPNDNFATGNNESHSNIATAAIYPSSLTNTASPSSTNIELPATQKYEEYNGHQKLEAPMAAYIPAGDGYTFTDNTPTPPPTFEFKNLCALLKVNIDPNGSTLKVTRIEVENTSTETGTLQVGEANVSVQKGRPLWGDFQIVIVNSDPILREKTIWNALNDPASNHIPKKVILNLSHFGTDNTHINGGKQISGPHSFYLYLPPVHYKNLHVAVYVMDASGNERCTILESTKEGDFSANTIYPLNVTYNANDNSTWHTINSSNTIGEYTVDEAGHKVTFSRSNIQGYAHDDDNSHHFLAQHQYHYIGYGNVYGLHDHFDQQDVATIMGLSQFNGWRLLNIGEFQYILNSRSGNRYAWAVVASVPGIILFPDGYNNAQGLAHFPSNYINIQNVGFANVVTIEADEWYRYFESQGCVFLPTISMNGPQASQINHQGFYWKRNPGTVQPYIQSHQIKFETGSLITFDLMYDNTQNSDNRAQEAYLRPVEDIVVSSPSRK